MSETKYTYPFTEEDILLRKSIRDFCRDKIIPHRDKWDEEERCPVELFPEMGELGFLGVYCPQEDGGSGNRMVMASVLMEELGYADTGFGQTVFAHIILAMACLFRTGTEAQKKKYLTPSIQGKFIGGLGITEPNVGSDVAGIEMHASRHPSAKWSADK